MWSHSGSGHSHCAAGAKRCLLEAARHRPLLAAMRAAACDVVARQGMPHGTGPAGAGEAMWRWSSKRPLAEVVELLGAVAGRGGELPVVAAVPTGGVPRRAHRRPAQLGGEGIVLLGSQMLEQTAECQRGGADAGIQPGRVEVVGLP